MWRGERHVLHGLSFALAAGEALQVMWANGTGKTSLLRALAGLVFVEGGEILWRGAPRRDDPAGYHAHLGFLGHDLGLKPDLTASENLRYGAGLHVACSRERVRDALARVGLTAMADAPVRHMSAGQQRRVALARLRLQSATLWLMDEPAANLDANGQQLVTELVEELLDAGGAAIVATHQPLPFGPRCRPLPPQPALRADAA